MPDYYEILGVTVHASEQEIRWAYRQLVFEFHPDRNQSSANAQFILQQINEAYQILANAERRREYDAYLFDSGLLPTVALVARPTMPYTKAFDWIKLTSLTVSKIYALFIAFSGALFILGLEESFIPLFPYTRELSQVLAVAFVMGGFAAAVAELWELPSGQSGGLGIILGSVLAGAYFCPENDSYAFTLVVQLALGCGMAGWLAVALPKMLWIPCQRPNRLTEILLAILLGGSFGLGLGLILGSQISEDIIFALIAAEIPKNFETNLIILSTLSAAGGALLGALKQPSPKQD